MDLKTVPMAPLTADKLAAHMKAVNDNDVSCVTTFIRLGIIPKGEGYEDMDLHEVQEELRSNEDNERADLIGALAHVGVTGAKAVMMMGMEDGGIGPQHIGAVCLGMLAVGMSLANNLAAEAQEDRDAFTKGVMDSLNNLPTTKENDA